MTKKPTSAQGAQGAQLIKIPLPARPQGIEERRIVGELLLRGYSVAAIDLMFYDATGKRLDRTWLDALHRKVHRSGKLQALQEREEAAILSTGLARKAERVRRLSDYVDAIERTAHIEPGKVGIEFRRGIEQIAREVEGLGIDVTIHPGDAWGNLLHRIAELGEDAASSATHLAQANVSPGTGDPQETGDPA